MSPATMPRGEARPAAAMCSAEPPAAARWPSRPCARSAPTIPLNTSPVPAVASRGVGGNREQRDAVGPTHHCGGALQQHRHTGVRGERPDRGEVIGTGWSAGERGELTRVGRDDGGVHPAGRDRGQVVGSVERVEAIAVDDDRKLRAGHDPAHRGAGGPLAAKPGTDDQGAIAMQVMQHEPVPLRRRQRPANVFAGRQRAIVDPRAGQPHVARAHPQRGAAAQRRRAQHPRGARHDHNARGVLVGVARAGGQPRARASSASTTYARADATSSPMSATMTSPACSGPSPNSSPGLSAAKVTVTWARTAPSHATPVTPSTPEGMSAARTGARPGCGA